MARVHFLTVGEGDCTIIEHNSGRVTMIDICGGNEIILKAEAKRFEALERPRGNFAMCKRPTNPVEYLRVHGIKRIFRFILTHPDMDHLDGFKALINSIPSDNFWDSGARKEKPDFEGSPYLEEDWDRYEKVRDGKEKGVNVVSNLAGARFQFANKGESESANGDGLYIAAPTKQLIEDANKSQEFNDASYIISYWSTGGRIIIPGDAHDGAWDYALQNHADDIGNCAFLLASHHGRDSDMSFDFLKIAQPAVSLLGCAPSEDLAYHAWRNRELYYFTQNQSGNVVLEIENGEIDVYVENDKFVESAGGNVAVTNREGYFHLVSISKG